VRSTWRRLGAGALCLTLSACNGDEIFPAMLAAIREAKQTIIFANFIYEKGDIARDMAHALAERPLIPLRDQL